MTLYYTILHFALWVVLFYVVMAMSYSDGKKDGYRDAAERHRDDLLELRAHLDAYTPNGTTGPVHADPRLSGATGLMHVPRPTGPGPVDRPPPNNPWEPLEDKPRITESGLPDDYIEPEDREEGDPEC